MIGYFQKLLPEDFLTYDEIVHWRFGPPIKPSEPDPRVGIGDLVRIMPFRARSGFPPHRLAHFSLFAVLSGSVTYLIEGETCVIPAGHALFLAPGFEHAVEPCGESDYGIMLALDPALIREHLQFEDLPAFAAFLNLGDKTRAYQPDRPYLRFHTGQWPGTQWYIDELCCEHFDPDRRTYLAFPHLLQMIFIALDRCTDITARKRQPTTPLTIQTILRYIKTNYQRVTLQTAAERFGFSPNYLSYMLKRFTGLSFQELKQSECMAQSARLLLETDMTVAQVAQSVGIRNVTHFYKLFEARYGVTPSKYRKAVKPD